MQIDTQDFQMAFNSYVRVNENGANDTRENIIKGLAKQTSFNEVFDLMQISDLAALVTKFIGITNDEIIIDQNCEEAINFIEALKEYPQKFEEFKALTTWASKESSIRPFLYGYEKERG